MEHLETIKNILGHSEERYLFTAQRFKYGNLVSLPFENLLWFELINFFIIDGQESYTVKLSCLNGRQALDEK